MTVRAGRGVYNIKELKCLGLISNLAAGDRCFHVLVVAEEIQVKTGIRLGKDWKNRLRLAGATRKTFQVNWGGRGFTTSPSS